MISHPKIICVFNLLIMSQFLNFDFGGGAGAVVAADASNYFESDKRAAPYEAVHRELPRPCTGNCAARAPTASASRAAV
uniref:Secreted protein n=1 Tax=Romanomermis culicivorax TaxID=13658 RepID=A0A915IFS2_ROMCU